MEKKSSPNENSIKLKLLDIFPSIKELEPQKNKIDIIFQGLDIFHNLFELLSTKKEITLKIYDKSSIIISLIKSNNLFATCVFNIKHGDQWLTFSYENKKKKDTSLAQSLIDCIKIKLNCEIQNINNNNITSKKNKFNLHNNSKINIGPVLTDEDANYSKLSIGSKILTNKGNKKINLESSSKENNIEKPKFSWIRGNNNIINNTFSNNYKLDENISNKKNIFDDIKNNVEEKKLRRMKTKKSYSKIKDDDLAIRLNKIIHKGEENKLNLTQRIRKNTNSNGNLDFSNKENKHYGNLIFKNFGTNKSQKNTLIIKNRLLNNSNKKAEIKNITNEYNNKKNETELSINNFNNSNNNDVKITKKRKNHYKIERSHDDIEKVKAEKGSMTNRRNKDAIKPQINNTNTNSKTPDMTRNNKKSIKYINSNNYKNTIECEKKTFNEDRDVNKHSYIFNNISSEIYSENEENNQILDDLSNNSNNENENFPKLKEDFILLYNENYIKNVQEDLLKLEIELFVEKMTELISTYHLEINEKKQQNKNLEMNLKENSTKYLKLCKLYFKLNLIKKNYKKKNLRLLKNRTKIKEINNKDFETNKNEINLFKLIFSNKKNENEKSKSYTIHKKEKLKNIINFLLTKRKNKTILKKNDLYKKWCEMNEINDINNNKDKINFEETNYKKPFRRARAIPKLNQTKFNSILNNNDLNNNTFANNENKSEEIIMNNNKSENNINYFIYNPDSEIFNKSSASNSLYPKKFYLRKILK